MSTKSGEGLFIVVESQAEGGDMRAQLLRKIGIVPDASSVPLTRLARSREIQDFFHALSETRA